VTIRRFILASVASVGSAVCLTGCSTPQAPLTAPQITLSPYEAPGEVLWAVVPFANESGTTGFDPLVVSDKVVAAAEQVRGIRCLPLNRTIEAMRALKMTSLNSPGDLATLARTLNVDGVLAGSITAYDPYAPTMGISMILYAKPGSAVDGATLSTALDAKALRGAIREEPPAASRPRDGVVASVSEHLDGKNHQVLMDVRAYADGRSRPTDALNWRRYVASMPLYEEFAASFAISRLMQSEWIRLGRAASQEANPTANAQRSGNVNLTSGGLPGER
jgi:hypothetical protein